VLKLAYEEAKQRGWKTAGVACQKVHEYRESWFQVDEDPVIVGEEWGDESETFVHGTKVRGHLHENGLDAIIRVGLGPQSLRQAEEVRKVGKSTYEYNLPKLE